MVWGVSFADFAAGAGIRRFANRGVRELRSLQPLPCPRNQTRALEIFHSHNAFTVPGSVVLPAEVFANFVRYNLCLALAIKLEPSKSKISAK